MSTFFVSEFELDQTHSYWRIVSTLSNYVAANLPALSSAPNVSKLDSNKFGLAFYPTAEEYPVLRFEFEFGPVLNRLQSWRITNSSALSDDQKERLTDFLSKKLKPFG